MIREIAEGITTKCNQDAELSGALTGGLWFQQAPQRTEMPYGVFRIMGMTQTEIMGNADDNIREAEISFSFFSNAKDGGEEIAVIEDEVRGCFDWQDISVDGFQYLKMQFDSMVSLELLDDIWSVVLNYSLGLIKE